MQFDRELKIFYNNIYHPWHHGQNPSFNNFSRMILDLKKCDSYDNKTVTLAFNTIKEDFMQFYKQRNFINAVDVVPSHSPNSISYGLWGIAKKLEKTVRWYKFYPCLQRTQLIQKLSQGGNRCLDTHFNSIKVRDGFPVQGLSFLLIDDVTTTGNSLNACREILFKAGAKKVITYAIAKTG